MRLSQTRAPAVRAVAEHSLTMSDAETVLRKLLAKIINDPHIDRDISIKSLTSGGANYTSALFSATITSKNEDPAKLFAKVANINGKLREMMQVKFMFETEQFVYKDLAKVYERIQKEHDVAPEYKFIFPKFYGGDDIEGEETVVLEDLVAKGYSPYSRFKPVDWEHAAYAVETLARFHALSFAFAKEDPENFAKAFEKLKYRHIKKVDDPVRLETWKKMMDAATQVAKDEHKDRISKFLHCDPNSEEIYRFRMPLSTPVLCHGDYRVSNLLFKRGKGHLETIVVDYQTVHPGCPAIDLLYLEFMGTDEEFRRENHERLVDHYFAELTLALDRMGLDVNEVYPRETFDSELRQMIPAALRAAAFILPLVLVEAERAPQLGESTSIDAFALSPNQQFAERFSGLISDCVRWGAI